MSRENKSTGTYDAAKREMAKSTDERFLRLEENEDKALVYFAEEPFTRYTFWDGQQTREWYEGCRQKKVLRLSQNVILCNIESDKLIILGVKVIEQGKRFYTIVTKRDERYGIHNQLFLIERSGGKGDKETRYEIEAEYELSDTEKKKLMAMELFDLEEFYAELAGEDGDKKKPSKKEKAEEPEKGDDDAIIDEEELNELLEMFKTLEDPETAGRKFCDEFDVKKVKFLRKSLFKKALKYMDKLTATEYPESDDDDDAPF